nr:vicilin-like seed storage protein At2g18540 [Ipomoea batatas]
MAGVSLQCGDCGALLKSVEEAQEHAELTKHTNFSESTEPILNLVCTTCGKPCRSKTESDLHTKRTGHKMVVPEVDQNLLTELEAMGFPKARATRALHYSGNASLEAAVNWVVEHESDPDVDEMPLVPVSSKKAESPKPSLTPEEIKMKQQELRKETGICSMNENFHHVEAMERIRIGKELLEAKRIEEENERKRFMSAELFSWDGFGDVEIYASAERRRKLGLPPEDPAPKPSEPVVEEKKSSLPVRPATKAEQMRECLRTLKQSHKDDEAKVKTAFNTLLTFAKNVATNPNEEKFRKIRLSNPAIQAAIVAQQYSQRERVGKLKGGVEFLELLGFEKIEGGEFLYLPSDEVDMAVLHSAGTELNSAINNPFFGVL